MNLQVNTSDTANPLEISYLPNKNAALQEINDMLNELPRYKIGIASWPEFSYQPEVHFSAAHDNKHILLKYYVQEQYLQAFYRQTNESVYKDSCVECFISWDDTGYYNFEFNCLGTCLAAFGPNRGNRKSLDAATIAKIQRLSAIHSVFTGNPAEPVHWTMTIKIPLEVFSSHDLQTLSQKKATANFYKCGDAHPQPHYLSWQKINTPAPDFHRPEFFGEIRFV
ncbi:carbohydrate-binding family 9-like protein [Rhodocytophaga aerolata]|uniref:Carbohydrate-binding family 9-like protein n=1 Tax=Rhodocytophaga aerolata TaxID=455078 RepID=A0ABT8R2B0_9BACT|nr:carbohydrate-binding family 9-like protein [Rhodocytophaga aerolata]MDO1445433.1 carbohydrate-binding family 9-like protein [Rhodocytophaga aerolata]